MLFLGRLLTYPPESGIVEGEMYKDGYAAYTCIRMAMQHTHEPTKFAQANSGQVEILYQYYM